VDDVTEKLSILDDGAKVVITNWRIEPEVGRNIIVSGTLNGKYWSTNAIKQYLVENGNRFIITASGAVFKLVERNQSNLEASLKFWRSSELSRLKKIGFFINTY